MQILLANPRGFCAGVNRAINIVENALKIYGAPVYVHHEIVHNSYIIDKLRKRGVIFVEKLDRVPDQAVLIFSAHGVSKKIYNEAKNRKLTVFDATCPLVARIHMKVTRISRCNEGLIIIGYKGHPEVEGIMGHYDNLYGNIYLIESLDDVFKLNIKNTEKLSLVTQTTLSVNDTFDIINALHNRFPNIIIPHKNSICYATTNRQRAVRILAEQVNMVLVVGSKNSSNANRLVEQVKSIGKPAFLINDANDIQDIWMRRISRVGVTAGASTPDILVQNVIIRLQELGGSKIISMSDTINKENVIFELPKELRIPICIGRDDSFL